VGKPEGERPLGRPRHRWENNIRMDLGEIRWGGIDWIHLSQDGNHYSYEHFNEPSGSMIFGEILE
jgi:hypothetical protein